MKQPKESCREVAAFFDLDGTLVAGPSLERRFFRALRYQRAIRRRNVLLWLKEAMRLAPRGICAMRYANKMHLRGVTPNVVKRQTDRISAFAEGINRLAWHAEQGHRIVIVSGTLEPLARKAARDLESRLAERGISANIGVLATRLEERETRWTGRIIGEAMFGKAKVQAVERLAAEMGLDLERSYAYGDGANDRWFLSAVGRPIAVNPSRGLARIAHTSGWPVEMWREEGTELTQRAQRAHSSQRRAIGATGVLE